MGLYTAYENTLGHYRLKVIMADIKWPTDYDIFYTYSYINGYGSYTFPSGSYNIGDVMGTYNLTNTQYFLVRPSNSDDIELASWSDSSTYNYITQGGGGDIDIVKSQTSSVPPYGSYIDGVSCQITGDYRVHTYRYVEVPSGTITRKIKVTNLKTGVDYNFTNEDLKITDVSPLGSDTQRWKLLSGIGVYENTEEVK
jgi:hypothetical protein